MDASEWWLHLIDVETSVKMFLHDKYKFKPRKNMQAKSTSQSFEYPKQDQLNGMNV